MKYAAIARRGLKFTANKKWFVILKLAIAGLLLFVLIRNIKPENIRTAISQANFIFIGLAAILLLPNFLVQCRKWHFLLKLSKPDATCFEAGRSLLAGFTLGFITPGRIGELGRAIFVKDCNRLQLVGLTMVDKLFSMTMVFLMGAIALYFFSGVKLGSEFSRLLLFIALSAIFWVILLVFFPDQIRKIIDKIKSKLPFKEKSELLLSGLNSFHRPHALKLFGLNFIFYATYSSQFYLLLSAFEFFPVIDGYLVVAATIFAKSLLPISFGDLGVRETAAVYFVTQIGAQSSTAFNAAILMFIINIVFPALVGFGLLMADKLNGQFLKNSDR